MTNVAGRIGRFFTLLAGLFVVGLVAVVYVRLDDQALSMVAGFLMLGVPLVIVAIIGVVILWLVVRAMEARAQVRRYDPRAMPAQASPPVIVMNPNGQAQAQPMIGAMPYYGGNGAHQPEIGGTRTFEILGGE